MAIVISVKLSSLPTGMQKKIKAKLKDTDSFWFAIDKNINIYGYSETKLYPVYTEVRSYKKVITL